MVRNLGAEVCVDYKVEDYSLRKENYDIVFDAVGKTSKSKAKKVLSKGGKFVSVSMPTQEKDEHLLKIKNMAEEGSLIPWIDKTYPLEQIVEAHTYVDEGHKRGNVSIQL
jgi:NADPH:quinone reductase-like Zn-dependent oxidoreductase